MTGRILAVSYARVSSDDQREAETIGLQREMLPRWCPERGIELFRTYEDDGVSGTVMLPERPGGAQLLRDLPDLRAAGVSLLLLYNWSRLGREPWVVWGAIYDLEKLGGLRLRSITEEADTSTPERVLMLCLGTGMASMERARFLQVSRDATNIRAENGAWLGGTPPYGYRVTGHGRTARLEIDETPFAGMDPVFGLNPAEVVRRVYQWSAAGETLAKLCARLNALGVPSSFRRESASATGGNAHHWYPARLRGLLINPVYRGEHQYGRRSHGLGTRPRQVISRPAPELVPEELWTAAQETLARNKKRSGRNTKRLYLLRTLLRCTGCGCSYVGRIVNARGGPTRYYSCSRTGVPGLPEGRKCTSGAANAEFLEEIVWRDVSALARHPEQLRATLAKDRERGRAAGDRTQDQLLALRRALLEREAQRARVISWARQQLITEQDLTRELLEIGREEGALREQVQQLEREARAVELGEAQLAAAEALLEVLRADLDELDWDKRRKWLLALIERIELSVTGKAYQRELAFHIVWRFGQ